MEDEEEEEEEDKVEVDEEDEEDELAQSEGSLMQDKPMTISFGNIDSISKAFLMLYDDLLFLLFDFDSISMAFLMLYDLLFLQL